ncbi:Ada metal-binding domain-containing protein [Nonomuraea jabiensis]|uniref:Ada metal-binding domain-containing protein n=1 Tax=Nonomuraea jabiensis TaxID=882448 RepID=UPI003413FA0A
MLTDEDAYSVLRSRDGRFDGRFFVAVVTTGIFCRPSCPAALPKRENEQLPGDGAALSLLMAALSAGELLGGFAAGDWRPRIDRLVAIAVVELVAAAGFLAAVILMSALAALPASALLLLREGRRLWITGSSCG